VAHLLFVQLLKSNWWWCPSLFFILAFHTRLSQVVTLRGEWARRQSKGGLKRWKYKIPFKILCVCFSTGESLELTAACRLNSVLKLSPRLRLLCSSCIIDSGNIPLLVFSFYICETRKTDRLINNNNIINENRKYFSKFFFRWTQYNFYNYNIWKKCFTYLM
jgi:hypothetical protein